jgi:hypothetical protein
MFKKFMSALLCGAATTLGSMLMVEVVNEVRKHHLDQKLKNYVQKLKDKAKDKKRANKGSFSFS